MSGRAVYLLQSDLALLDVWAREVRRMFGDGVMGLHLVGSSLERTDFRDVDVRIMLDDQYHDDLAALVDLDLLNLSLSLWGQKATGLPVDCQVQHMSSANEDYGPRPRRPVGTRLAASVSGGVDQ